MTTVTYEIVTHDGGFAYKVGDVFSETFPTHDDAYQAAADAAERQHVQGSTHVIQFQDAKGDWHTEVAAGGDRPETAIKDDTSGDEDAPREAELTPNTVFTNQS